MNFELKDCIKDTIKFFMENDYMDQPTTFEEAVSMIEDIVNDAIEESAKEMAR